MELLAKMMYVVNRTSMPQINDIEIDGTRHKLGILKDFRKHPIIKQYLPDMARVSLAWVHLAKDEELSPHRHDTVSMIIIAKGKLKSSVEENVELEEGDIAVIPPHILHGFIGSSDGGIWAISLQFEGDGLYENPNHARVIFENSS